MKVAFILNPLLKYYFESVYNETKLNSKLNIDPHVQKID